MSHLISELIYNYCQEKDLNKKSNLYIYIVHCLNKIYGFEGIEITKFLQSEINKFISRKQDITLFEENLSLEDFANKVYCLNNNKELSFLTLSELFLALLFTTNISEYHVRRQYKLLDKIQNSNDNTLDKVSLMKEKCIDKYQDELINNIITTIKKTLPINCQDDDRFRKILHIGYVEVSDNNKIIEDLKKYYCCNQADLSYYQFLLKASCNYKK